MTQSPVIPRKHFSGMPAWAVYRVQMNLDEEHTDKLEAILVHLRKSKSRTTVSAALEEAIAVAYDVLIPKVIETV